MNEISYASKNKKITEPIKNPQRSLRKFFTYHSENIEEIVEKGELIDGFIFIFCGHGQNNTLLAMDGKAYSITNIHNLFANDSLPELYGHPKIFVYDKCRSGEHEQMIGMNVQTTINA